MVVRAPGYAVRMGIGTGIFLLAVGAILKFAVTDAIAGVDLATVGVILMVAGVIGLLISLLYAACAATARRGAVARDRVVERDPLAVDPACRLGRWPPAPPSCPSPAGASRGSRCGPARPDEPVARTLDEAGFGPHVARLLGYPRDSPHGRDPRRRDRPRRGWSAARAARASARPAGSARSACCRARGGAASASC